WSSDQREAIQPRANGCVVNRRAYRDLCARDRGQSSARPSYVRSSTHRTDVFLDMPVVLPDSLPELAAIVEMTEGAAYADLLHAAPPEWGCVAEETSCGWLLMAPPLDMLLSNRIVGCGVREPARSAPLLD